MLIVSSVHLVGEDEASHLGDVLLITQVAVVL
jgi:hypothetical protein